MTRVEVRGLTRRRGHAAAFAVAAVLTTLNRDVT